MDEFEFVLVRRKAVPQIGIVRRDRHSLPALRQREKCLDCLAERDRCYAVHCLILKFPISRPGRAGAAIIRPHS